MRRPVRWLALVLAACVTLVALPAHVASAQSGPPPVAHLEIDYQAWEALASRAEKVVAEDKASTTALETLRKHLTDWRGRLQSAKSTNEDRIKTLVEQIDALGPVPEEGFAEPEAIAARREALNDQLKQAQAPSVAAGEAFSRADGLIREIDKIISDRKTGLLFRLGPSPLNPETWPGAFEGLGDLWQEIVIEIERSWSSPAQQNQRKHDATVIGVLFVLALLLLSRGRRWFLKLVNWMVPRGGNRFQRELRWVLVSLSSLAMPMLGLFLLTVAIRSTGLLGIRGEALLAMLPAMGLFLFGSRWIGSVIFSSDERAPVFCNLEPAALRTGRHAATVLGLLMAIAILLARILDQPMLPENAKLVLGFPIILAMGLTLVRLGRVLKSDTAPAEDQAEGVGFRERAIFIMSRAMIAVGIAGPVLAGIGYFAAGGFFLFPSVMSLTLVALLAILNRLFVNIFALVIRADPDKGVGELLLPVVFGTLLVLLSLPLFALIWGTRPAKLMELWALLRDGFTIGGISISFGEIMAFIVIFAVGYMITRLIQSALRTTVLPRTKLDVGGREAIVTGTGYLGIFLAAVIAITTAGIDLSSLAIVAGALSVGIGFGLQTIVSNFVSGIILLIERPIKKGDWIEVGGIHGNVREISVRSTRIETFDRSDVIVPNADLIAGRVTNYTHVNMAGRVIVPVGVAYGTDTRQVEEILLDVAKAHPMVLLNPAPYVLFRGFGADSLDFEIRAILRDVNWMMNTHSDMNHEIAKRFTEAGIEIPFGQRDIWLRNPEVLPGARVSEPPAKGEVDAAGESPATPTPTAPPAGMEDGGSDGGER